MWTCCSCHWLYNPKSSGYSPRQIAEGTHCSRTLHRSSCRTKRTYTTTISCLYNAERRRCGAKFVKCGEEAEATAQRTMVIFRSFTGIIMMVSAKPASQRKLENTSKISMAAQDNISKRPPKHAHWGDIILFEMNTLSKWLNKLAKHLKAHLPPQT